MKEKQSDQLRYYYRNREKILMERKMRRFFERCAKNLKKYEKQLNRQKEAV